MSSISRRRNGLMALSVIGGLLSWVRSSAPRSQDRTPASATPRDPSLAANYRGSGLVLRRISHVQVPRGDGLFSESRADAQLWPWETPLVPLTGPCGRERATPRSDRVGIWRGGDRPGMVAASRRLAA